MVRTSVVTELSAPARFLGQNPDLSGLSQWGPELAETFVHLATDIALLIDSAGVIQKVVQSRGQPMAPGAAQWIGQPWLDTVTGESRTKVEQLLREVALTGIGRRREVNHSATEGGDSIPVSYTGVRLGEAGPLLVVGKDLRAVAAIQQRFLETQREMEQSYWKARQSDSRYELLFQVATDAVFLVDAQTFSIVEANPAAARLFDLPIDELLGRNVTHGFEKNARAALEELLLSSRSSGRPTEIRARLATKQTLTSVAATPFRLKDGMRLLVRWRTRASCERTSRPAFSSRGIKSDSDSLSGS